ncbi:MAG: hypothetical protein ACFHU9_01085 [Fluviicola sp.]
MTKSEAKLYLEVSDLEELDEVYEEKVFEWKNFFVNRFPVSSLFRSKVKQLEKLEAAYQSLGGGAQTPEEVLVDLYFSDSFKEAFHQFSERRSRLKALLFQASSAKLIGYIVAALVDLTQAYAQVWNDSELETNGIAVSKEADPMDLLAAIDDAAHRGVHNISEIEKLPEDHLVVKEAKRLSLWIKMSKK